MDILHEYHERISDIFMAPGQTPFRISKQVWALHAEMERRIAAMDAAALVQPSMFPAGEDAPLFTLPEDPAEPEWVTAFNESTAEPSAPPTEPQIEFEYHMMSPANLDIVNDCIDYAWPKTIAGCWAHLDKLLERGTIPQAQYDEIKAGGDFIIAD